MSENSYKSDWEVLSDVDHLFGICSGIQQVPHWFGKFPGAFSHSENLGFGNGFICFPESGNRSKSGWEFPSEFDAVW